MGDGPARLAAGTRISVAALGGLAAGEDLELTHHVVVLVRAVVAVEDELVLEVPELVAHHDRLVGPDPHRVLEAVALARTPRAARDAEDLEAPEVQVDRVAPAA